MSYVCATCKTGFDGEAAITNNCGSFCVDCKRLMHERSVDARREGVVDGLCKWCGERLHAFDRTGGTGRADGSVNNVCRPCRGMRDRLLKCIRHSKKAAEYVAAREEEEAPRRVARDAERAASSTSDQEIKIKRSDLERLLAEAMRLSGGSR